MIKICQQFRGKFRGHSQKKARQKTTSPAVKVPDLPQDPEEIRDEIARTGISTRVKLDVHYKYYCLLANL